MRLLHGLALACLALTACSQQEQAEPQAAYAEQLTQADLDKALAEDLAVPDYNQVSPPEDTNSKNETIPEGVVENSSGPSGNLDPALAEAAIPIPRGRSPRKSPTFPIPAGGDDDSGFSCSTPKTCPMMRSCKEAYYHLNKCGDTARDRDGDGVPCENIC
jgi:hypothetical protein